MSMIVRDTFTSEGLKAFGGVVAGALVNAPSILALNVLWDLYKSAKVSSTVNLAPEAEQYEFHIKNMMLNIGMVMWSLSRYYFINSQATPPAAVIAGIPLGTVSELSHAMSHRDLKYRSKGGIFLAHQPGGEQSLRIEGKAIGKNRYILLIMLDLLFRYGNSRMWDLAAKPSSIYGPAIVTKDAFKDMTEENKPWKDFNRNVMDEGREEFHLTFPVITRQRIYMNMYIETYEFTESIEHGMNVINFTLFFRKFQPPFPPRFIGVSSPDPDKEVRYFYREENNDSVITKLRKFDMGLEFGYSVALLLYRVFVILVGNSPEHNIAMITALGLNKSIVGNESTAEYLVEKFNFDSVEQITGLSIENKEELMQVE